MLDLKQREGLTEIVEFVRSSYEESGLSFEDTLERLEILMDLRPDNESIVAILLYEAYLRGKLNAEFIKEKFGANVLDLLLSVKRLEGLNFARNESGSQLQILKRMFLAMAKDLRGIFVALSLRLQAMRHLERVNDHGEQVLMAREVFDIYVPVAARLGVYKMKTELEDLAFKFMHPFDYASIVSQLQSLGRTRKYAISWIKRKLNDFFAEKGLEAEISGRTKGLYSIYKKLKKKNLLDISALYDIFAIRIVVPSRYDEKGEETYDQLYSTLGLIHGKWKPLSRRFKDYIALPKSNGYRSLHTVILGITPMDMAQPVEIQIRSSAMHSQAEYGFAAHWLYKVQVGANGAMLQEHSEWLKGLQDLTLEGDDNVKELDLDVFKDRIFVLTPSGEVKDLPAGSCPIDFAYSVHTNLGHSCVMSKVNGSVVSLDHELKNGDVVEIVSRKGSVPKLQWLSMVRTNSAKNRIKAWFSIMNRDANIREGRKLLNAQLMRIGKAPLDQNYSIFKNFGGETLSLGRRETLVEEVGTGAKMAHEVVKKIFPYDEMLRIEKSVPKKLKKNENVPERLESKVLVGGESGLPVKFPACCKPQFGDSVIAYVTKGTMMTIHKFTCSLLNSLDKERLIFAGWQGIDQEEVRYRVRLKIRVISRLGLMRDITQVISGLDIDILSVNVKHVNAKVNDDYYLLALKSPEQFDLLVDKLERVSGVLKVARG